MITRITLAIVLAAALVRGEIVDRIAIIVNKRVVKDSDIELDLRVTAFLNQTPVSRTPAARKESAQRLIDQLFIRDEIAHGDSESAPVAEGQRLLTDLKKTRFNNDIAYQNALRSHGITEDDLKEKLFFQTTVLRFIDIRFKPGIFVTDNEIKTEYDAHRQQYRGTLEATRDAIEDKIAGERVNKLLFDWLAQRRKEAKIVYREEELR
jgi:peptidyl-prolyl cis-trans isomerase SurA